MPTPSSSPPRRLLELDLLRFLASFCVVLYHLSFVGFHLGDGFIPVNFTEIDWFTRYGYLGVDLFFIVSGYVIFLSAYGKSLRQFIISRLSRLYPAYWVGCSISFLAMAIWGLDKAVRTATPQYVEVPLSHFAVNLTMLQDFLKVPHLDGVFWTLHIELLFYFLIALIIVFNGWKHVLWLLTIWLANSALYWFYIIPKINYFLIPQYTPLFAAGILFYLLEKKMASAWKLYSLLACAYVLAVASAVKHALELSELFNVPISPYVAAGTLTSIFACFFLVIFRPVDVSRFTWWTKLGVLTYPLYLIHENVGFIAFQQLAGKYNKYLLLLFIISAVLALAYGIHTFVEKRYSRKFAQWLTHRFAVAGERQ